MGGRRFTQSLFMFKDGLKQLRMCSTSKVQLNKQIKVLERWNGNGAAEKAQQLKAVAVLAEGAGSILSMCMVVHNYL